MNIGFVGTFYSASVYIPFYFLTGTYNAIYNSSFLVSISASRMDIPGFHNRYIPGMIYPKCLLTERGKRHDRLEVVYEKAYVYDSSFDLPSA